MLRWLRPAQGRKTVHARGAPYRGWLIAVGFLLVAAVTGLAYAKPGMLRHSQGPYWKRIWSDNFIGPAGSGINTDYWRYQTGRGIFGNGSVEVMTSSRANVHLDGHGTLDITALHQGTEWTSGRIQTRTAFTPPAGGALRVVATLQQPDPVVGLGYWPAFWMLGRGAWPSHGEIDILEDVDGLSEHSGALHCGNLKQLNGDGTYGPCHEYNGRSSGTRPCPGCQTGFHTYGVIIDRRNPADEQIRWYLDQREFFSVSERQVGAAAWNTAVNHGFSIIFDLAIGGTFPNLRCDCVTPSALTTSGGTLQVRNVAVYSS
jgi:beta-glucanase (GH16 family)